MFLFSEGEHAEPLIVEFLNHYLGESVSKFQIAYTKPIWESILKPAGTTPEALFGEYRADTAIPWYTVMFVIACLLTMAVIWIFKGKLSDDNPTNGQMTLEAGYLALRDMVANVIGEHGMKYFPVVATFAVLILISNLMGLIPLFMSPTASINVTLAFGISSFVYYTYIGIKENGIYGYLAHFAGPKLPLIMALIITPLIFLIELISNSIRPLTLSVRLFVNMFADEKVAETIANLAPPYTQILVPIALLPMALFVAFVQSFVFTLLSMIYLSEVSHAHSEEHQVDEHSVAHA